MVVLMKDKTIVEMGFSSRTFNCLRRANIFFLSQLMALTEEQMKHFRNMGNKSICEVLTVQDKIRKEIDFDENVLMVEAENHKKLNISEMLMVHKAFPQIIGKEIVSLLFKNSDGIFEEDIPIENLEFSVRTNNALHHAGISTIKELAFKEVPDMLEIKNMGSKSMHELIEYLRVNTEINIKGDCTDVALKKIREIVLDIIYEEKKELDSIIISRELEIALVQSKDILENATNNHNELWEIIKSNEFCERILLADNVIKSFQRRFLSIFRNSKKEVGLSILESEIPKIFCPSLLSKKLISNLLNEGKIEEYRDGYRIRLPYLCEWIETLSDKYKIALSLRLENKTLEECGNVLGITRERVRQIVSKTLKNKPKLREDDYSYWYSEYSLDYESMQMIFNIDYKTFIYLSIVYKQGEKEVELIEQDSNLTSEIYVNVKKYINRNSILVNGEFVPCKRELLCRKLAQCECSDITMSMEVLYSLYMELLSTNGMDMDTKLSFPTERAFEARLQDSNYILMKYGRKVRYYPIDEYDVKDIVKQFHFEQLRDVEISTLKLFREFPEVMEEYNILDEYELHNLLKKTEKKWNENNIYNVQLTRMPLMVFGEVDRAKQTEILLYQVAPVSLEEFAQFYEMEYGVLERTVIANMTPYISMYYHEGYYNINQPIINQAEREYLERVLLEDFYFIEDVKHIFIEKFGIKNISHINPRTYKELGFKVFSNYVIKSCYSSADEYFKNLYIQNKILDLTVQDSRMVYVQSANQALDRLRSDFELLEYEDKKYICFDHFSKVAGNITKNDLLQYVETAIDFSEEKYFTIHWLIENGFVSKFHNLGFGEWFNAALLKNSKKIRFIKAGGNIIFGKLERQITCLDFLRYLMKRLIKIDIYDFIDLLESRYRITFTKEKVAWLIKDSELYYDSIMQKLYYTKEIYYDDF